MKAQISIMLHSIQYDLDEVTESLKDLQNGLNRLSTILHDPKNIEPEKLVCEHTRNCCHFRAKDCKPVDRNGMFVETD